MTFLLSHRHGGRALVFAILCGTVGGAMVMLAAGASGPSTTAASSTTKSATAPATRAVAALQADTLLSAFPRNAAVIPNRSDARALTIEGRVRDVRTAALPAAGGRGGETGATEVRVVVVGKSQTDDAAPHFTCHMDKASTDEAGTLKPDMVIRLTGAVGAVTAAADRIDLMNCHDLTLLGDLTLGQQIVGRWTSPLAPDDSAPARGTRGRSGATELTGQAHVEIAFAVDGTFGEEVFDGVRSIRKVAGRWSVPKPKTDDDKPRLRLEPKGMAVDEEVAEMQGERLSFKAPGIADLRLDAQATATKIVGAEFAVDHRAIKDQVMRWLSSNIGNIYNQQDLLRSSSDYMDRSQGDYSFDIGGGLLPSKRITQVLVAGGKMFLLPYTDLQTQHARVSALEISMQELHPPAMLMVPETKIDAVQLDGKTTISLGLPIAGKIAFHTLGKPLDAQYMVMMSSVHGTAAARLDKKPGPDSETFDFSIALGAGAATFNEPDPVAVIFTICRQNRRGDPSGDQKIRTISEPIAQLMDIKR